MNYDDGRCSRFFDTLPYFTRFLGISTAVVLWGIGFDMTYHNHVFGKYLISASAIMFFFEITWAITLFLQVCLRNERSLIFTCWSVILWFDSWKKAVVYFTIATVLMVKPHKLWLTTLAGGMLISLGILYFLQGLRKRYVMKETLLQQHEETYDRFEDDAESINGELSNEQESESVSNNEYVMQV
ncbi:UNVERIFIED_CONTAM: hypothetical protein RMT77_002003 [Armadillidium vulgare]